MTDYWRINITYLSRVIVCHGKTALLEHEGEIIACAIRRGAGRPVCGDMVDYEVKENAQPRINQIRKRSKTLTRADFRGRARIIGANVDQFAIVVSASPEPDWDQIYRGVAVARLCDLPPLLIINKMDLAPSTDCYQEIEKSLLKLGCKTIRCSATESSGLEQICAAFKDLNTVLVGQSGVGKSTLSTQLLPDREIRIGALSAATGFGRHTTTETTWYPLPDNNGAIIDSPGMRDFAIWDMPIEDRKALFTEFYDYAGQCRFSNCRHLAEPDCAVKQAVEDNILSRRWYTTWIEAQEIRRK